MTIGWGYRITFLYLGFVAIIVTLVIISTGNKEELVSKDYYEQELKYQQKIDAINNEKSLSESIMIDAETEQLCLTIPQDWTGDEVTGELFLFCPSDSKKDRRIKLQFNKKGIMNISKKFFASATYKVNVSWQKDGKNYFKQHVILIN